LPKLFLLSPARVDGQRAQLLLNPRATFALARQFHTEGATLGELFAFASGLYFRGKLAYARRFADAERGDRIRVITTNAGLVDPSRRLSPDDLVQFQDTEIDEKNPRYRRPLSRHARLLAREQGSVILLGSIATPKYRDILLEHFGARLLFPGDFVGRGDMSRGALLLRAARDGRELSYLAVQGATLHGRRAPRVKSDRSGRRA
jgi:hypothetical protein